MICSGIHVFYKLKNNGKFLRSKYNGILIVKAIQAEVCFWEF